MNGDVVQILDVIDTLGTLGALLLITYAFYSGNLISRKVHNDIVSVYQKEAEKLVKAINGSMSDLTESQTRAIAESNRQHSSYLEDSQKSRQRVREASVEMMQVMQSILEHIKEHDQHALEMTKEIIASTKK